MKDTKCLFDEETQTPEGMVSVSQLQTYLSCAKKWKYGYIEEITPRIDKTYLTIGKLCHKGMQASMQAKWYSDTQIYEDKSYDENAEYTCWLNEGLAAIRYEWGEYIAQTPMLPEEMPDMEQILADSINVFTQAFKEFEPWKYKIVTLQKNGKPIPALELHFVVPCAGSKGLHGFIDAILKDRETGFTWCTDYKFRKSLSPDEEEAYNIQNAVYSWACHKMGVKVTGTMTWQHLNTPAADPAILKDGRISRSKIKTTWDHYREFCIAHGVDPEDYYLEMEEKLRDIEFFRPTYEYRNMPTIKRIWNDCVVPASRSVQKARNKKNKKYRSMYPWNCKMCQYQSLCQAELRGYDADAIRTREYTKRTHAK